MRLSWAKDPSGARPSIMPDGHRLIQAHDPCCVKLGGHVLVPNLDHLPDLPELVAKGWSRGICEDEMFSN